MRIVELFNNPSSRIKIAHFTVVVLLLINALFFTTDDISIAIQILLAIAVLIHHKDDRNIISNLISKQSQLMQESEIFDRNILITETDLKGVITYANKNYCDTTGYSKTDLLGHTHSIVKSKETSKETHKKLWDTITNNETYIGVMKNKKKDGGDFWVDIHISPVFIDSKKIAYKAIMFNITDKMINEQSLKHVIEDKELQIQKQSNRFEFAINSSRDGFWDYDLRTGEFYLSDGWKKRLGFEKNYEITYLDYLSLMPNEHRFEHHNSMHDILEKYDGILDYVNFRVQYPIVTKNSEKLIIEDVGDVFFDDKQNPVRITGFHRDITDQERQAKILESQNRVAAMGDMISNIAHQWRQPIGAINNTLNDLELDIELEGMKEVDSDVFLNTSKKVKEYTSYLSQTIDDFRKLSSNDKTKNKFLVKQTVENASKITQGEYEKNNIHFQLIISGDNICELYGYERELQQVVINLLNNAKDILVEREISKPSVVVTIISNASEITIIVHDNGGGIYDDIMPKIFDPYFTTKHEEIGTGIGLYMSNKIVDEHFNGTIEVENENGGARFSITLPR